MPTNADLIAQLKQAIHFETLSLENLRCDLACKQKQMDDTMNDLRLQEERVERFQRILKSAKDLAH